MNTHYCIVKKTWIITDITKKNFIPINPIMIYASFNPKDALSELEIRAIEFVNGKEGIEAQRKIYRKSKSGKYNYAPLGFFIVKGTRFPKMTIYRKTFARGVLYGTTEIKKIATFSIFTWKEMIEEEEIEVDNYKWEDLEEEVMNLDKCLIVKKNGVWSSAHAMILKRAETKLTVV